MRVGRPSIVATQVKERSFLIFSSSLESIYRSEKMSLIGKQLNKYKNTIGDILQLSPDLSEYINVFTSENPSRHKRLPASITDSVSIGKNTMVHIELEVFYVGRQKRYLLAKFKMGGTKHTLSNFQADYGLSMRENQIAVLAIKGASSHQISEQLAISHWSVKNHLKNVYKKTGVNNRILLAQLSNTIDL